MNLRLDVYVHFPDFADLKIIVQRITQMASQLDALTAAVARNTDVTESAITLLNGLKQKLDELIAAGSDPAALQALADSLGAETQKLADAVTVNTPAA